jgi:hypothetical protein
VSIVRGPRPESGWYALDRRISEDARLSWAARGVLVFLLGKPDNWRISVEHLRKQTAGARVSTGRDGIYALLKELQGAGYLRVEQARSESGTLGPVDYFVSEVPSPLPDQPDAARPLPARPLPAGTTVDKTEGATKTDVTDAPASPAGGALALIPLHGLPGYRFEEFWRAYPEKKGKADARKKWIARKLDPLADRIIAHVGLMLAEDAQWRRGFIPHGSTYINGSRWEDEPSRAGEEGAQGESSMKAALRGLGALS